MSRIGKMPINIPAGVTVSIDAKNVVTVKGPKGQLTQDVKPQIKVEVQGSTVLVSRSDDQKESRSLHGLYRTIINNMVVGVSQGYDKHLVIVGTGYRAQMQGTKLVMQLGFSHPVEVEAPQGISFDVPKATKVAVEGVGNAALTEIVVSGHDKQQVGEIAAKIRRIRPAEPYLGKGIRYVGEHVRRKEGKAAS